MKNFNEGKIRTDLVIESREMMPESDIEGIRYKTEENEEFGIKVTLVDVVNEEGAAAIGKPVGSYVTIESEAIKENDTLAHEEIAKILSQKLALLHKLHKDAVILVVGLGNRSVTPDALGPKVVSKILVTRHLGDALPTELEGKVRRVSAVAPGVMGQTGIETREIVTGIVERVKPDLVIAIDALAARRANRINAAIQMSDTGINPGAGIGNKRKALNIETLGVPVIAIGVPTVVDAATLVNDTMDILLESMISETDSGTEFYTMLAELKEEEKYEIIKQVLDPYTKNMFVTPKEVDAVIERLSAIIANALNIGLHPGIDRSDLNRYLEG
ncbi:MAG: GPR endopeptidase [Clostridiales bacterium]|nr:GPR endopeptidase [Clostridiales bacterium]